MRAKFFFDVCRIFFIFCAVRLIFSLSLYFYRPQTKFAKVIFLHVCVCLQGGVPGQVPPWDKVPPRDQVHPQGPGTPQDQVHPPGPGTPPWDQVHPPRTRDTPQTRYTLLRPGTPTRDQVPPWDQVHPPGTRYTPLGPGTPQDQVHPHPPGPGTPPPPGPGAPPQSSACWEISQQAGGTHPTVMYSCFLV